MTIKIHCSDCGKAYKMPDDSVGKRFTCKKCGQVIEVPGSVASADDDPLDALADTDWGNSSYDDLDLGDDLETGDAPAPAGRRRSSAGDADDDYRDGPPPSSGLAIASLVLGILSIPPFCLWCVSLPLAVTAIVLGAIARSQASSGKAGGAGIALAGIICGVIAILLTVALIAALPFMGEAEFMKEIRQNIEQMQQEMEEDAMEAEEADDGIDGPGDPADLPEDDPDAIPEGATDASPEAGSTVD